MSIPVPCSVKRTRTGVICKSDFFGYIYSSDTSEGRFKDIGHAFRTAGSLKRVGRREQPVETTRERVDGFFTFIEPSREEFHGEPSGHEPRNPGVVMLTDDEDFVV